MPPGHTFLGATSAGFFHKRLQLAWAHVAASDITQRPRPFANRLTIDITTTRATNHDSKRVRILAEWREGDKFDYSKWLERVREGEAQAKQGLRTFISKDLIAPEIGNQTGTSDGIWPNLKLMTRTVPTPRALRRPDPQAESKTPKARVMRRLERISSAWDDFQASRARDAVYGYLEAVFAIVDEGLWLAFLRALLLAPVDRRADRVSYFGGVVELRTTALARRAYCKGLIVEIEPRGRRFLAC